MLPALLRKFHQAKLNGETQVTVWGTGSPRREFLYVDDLAEACLFLLEHYESAETINVATGEDMTICDLAKLVRTIVYPDAEISFDSTRPDGTPRKLLDVSKLHALGWRHQTDLREGIQRTYDWYRNQDLAADSVAAN